MKQITDKMLEQLKTQFYVHPHQIGAYTGAPADYDGRHCWNVVEEKNDYTALVDSGHGHVALFKQEELLGVGRFNVEAEFCVLLDKDYYGITKYLWF